MHIEVYQENGLLILSIGTGFLSLKNSFLPTLFSIKPKTSYILETLCDIFFNILSQIEILLKNLKRNGIFILMRGIILFLLYY